jgi:hypothetical protein
MALSARSLDPATVSALAAIFGSLAGALASSVSTWITQRRQDRRDLFAKKLFHREQLYSDFISESARVIVDAIQHSFQDPSRLVSTYGLISRMRLSSSTNVTESAERLVETILHTYSEPNRSPEEIQARAEKRDDPLRDFSNICHRELETLWNGL